MHIHVHCTQKRRPYGLDTWKLHYHMLMRQNFADYGLSSRKRPPKLDIAGGHL